jgi:hypothetical protein
MKNSSKKLCKILKAVGKFVEEEFQSLSEQGKVKKIGEFLGGFEKTKKRNGTFLVILQLPEGVKGAIDLQGRLYDLSEIFE